MIPRTIAVVLSLCAMALPVSAADYPDHAIRIIVPFAAGGGTDVLARIIAQNLNSKWGQPVVVENQPGASGAIGTRAVMKAPPDGYTLLMASTGALMAVSGADGDGPFERQQGARADRDRRGAAISARRQPEAAGQLDSRSDPPGKRKARWLDVRLLRRGGSVASVRPVCSLAKPESSCCTFPIRAPDPR